MKDTTLLWFSFILGVLITLLLGSLFIEISEEHKEKQNTKILLDKECNYRGYDNVVKWERKYKENAGVKIPNGFQITCGYDIKI